MRLIPITEWLPAYDRHWLRRDLVAGAVVASILIPEGMAYAQIAGLGPDALFRTAPFAILGYALLGPSRRLVVATSGAAAALSGTLAASLAAAGSPEFARVTATVAVIAGVAAIGFGLLRFGFVSSFLSRPVAVGFVFGLAGTIAVKQAPKLLGVEAPAHGEFFERLGALLSRLGETRPLTLAIGAASLVALVVLERFARRVPAPLVVLAAAIIASELLGLEGRGVAVVGAVKGGLALPALPIVPLDQLLALVPGALGLALVVYAEGIGAAEGIAARHGERVRPNQELIGLGGANLLAGLFRGFPVGSSLSNSAANDAAGASTPVSTLAAAALTLIVGLALTGLLAPLPEATLAAIVIHAIWGMFDVRALREFLRVDPPELAAACAAILGVLALGTMPGLALGVGLSLLLLALSASRIDVAVLGRRGNAWVDQHHAPDAAEVPGVLVTRPNGQLWFANAGRARDRVAALVLERHPRALVVDLEVSWTLDVTSVEMLQQALETLRRQDVFVVLARVHERVRERLGNAGLLAGLEGRIFMDVEAAVAAARTFGASAPVGAPATPAVRAADLDAERR